MPRKPGTKGRQRITVGGRKDNKPEPDELTNWQDQNMVMRIQSEEDLRRAILEGELRENRFLDVKLRPDSKSDRREAARDLASFALDGGIIVFGVHEDSSEQLTLAPFPLARESERVEGIAANAIEPALPIRVHAIPSDADPAIGYLVVEVPPSPLAPHMVDHEYWGRAERTKRKLGDAEIVRLHASRLAIESIVESALDEEIKRDPTPRPRTRMLLVAEPLQRNPNLARPFTRAEPSQMLQITGLAESRVPSRMTGWSPGIRDLHAAVRRAQGLARTNLHAGRTVLDASEADYAGDIEFQTSGSIRAFVSGLVYDADVSRLPGPVPILMDAIGVAWAFRVVAYAHELAATLNYRGPWGFGVHIYGIQGVRAHQEDSLRTYQRPIYELDEFRFVTTASRVELEHNPGAVVHRLLGDLLMALESEGLYRAEFEATI